MITQRLRGLVNLHSAVATMIGALLFLAYANLAKSHALAPFIDVSADLPLTPYLLCVIAGAVVSTRYLLLFTSRFHRLTWVDAARITNRQVVYIALLIFTLMFALKDRAVSRIFLGSYLCLLWGILLFVNQGLPRFLSRLLFARQHKAPTLFIGTAAQIGRLRGWLATKEVLGIQPVGFLTEVGMRGEGTEFPFLGVVDDLAQVIDEKMVALVIVLEMPRKADGRSIIEICQDRGCRLLIYSDLGDQLQFPLVPIIEEGHAFFSLQQEPLEDPINRLVKRLFDIAISLPVVVLILPTLYLWVWMMQRVQAPGPVMFVQKRSGHRRNEFNIFKFRSMYYQARGATGEAVQARRGDDRIFPFGRFMRHSSLDEFPQFLNVLRGDMSIVGPRPHMPVHDTQFSQFYKGYRTRHFAKPGITGLAQTRGFRGEISDPALLQQRVQNDLYYIANWSIWLDLQITAKTFWQIFNPLKTAY